MKRRKLNYRFHNPNSIEVTATYLEKLFIEVNANKVEQALQAAASQSNHREEKELTCV